MEQFGSAARHTLSHEASDTYAVPRLRLSFEFRLSRYENRLRAVGGVCAQSEQMPELFLAS
jgi:hypothetical protein